MVWDKLVRNNIFRLWEAKPQANVKHLALNSEKLDYINTVELNLFFNFMKRNIYCVEYV